MVKVGFICEGFTEFYLLQSQIFKDLLQELNIDPVNVINAEGCGNLLPHNIGGYIKSLEEKGAKRIIILTDLDKDVCITKTKQRIAARPQDVAIVAVRQIESWFLASTKAMQNMLNQNGFDFQFPEDEFDPFTTINNLLVNHTGKGIGKNNGGKIKLINRLILNGIDLKEAAAHPNCSSAKYFIQKLKQIGSLS